MNVMLRVMVKSYQGKGGQKLDRIASFHKAEQSSD
jgi:hypothetical protein